MQTFRLLLALAGIVAVVALLIMKKDTKTVLIGVGLVLCVLCLKPLDGLNAFTSYMTKAGLIKAICASMGFAFVMKFTGCDRALIRLLTRPLGNLGFLLIPIVVALTYFINIAIPSAAGCSAAVGATMIPLLMAAGIKPEMAGAAVFAGTFGGVLSPGSAHNVFVADMVKAHNPSYTVQDVIAVQFSSAITALIVVLIVISITAIVCKDYTRGVNYLAQRENSAGADGASSTASSSAAFADSSNLDAQPQKLNVLHALMPLVPLVILIIGGTSKLNTISFLKWTKMGVAEAMLLGAIVTIVITMTNPQKITKEFFKGMGSAYADIMGIIIAAGVFVAGLSACGAIDFVIEWLKGEQGYVKFGGTFVPFFMGVVTGSGDAAAMAFNTAVTVHADQLGFAQDKLGMAVAISGALGRSASPIAGGCIVCAGLAMVSPIQIAKRTALGMFLSVCVSHFSFCKGLNMDIVQRFLNYTKINTTTNRAAGAAGIMPSNPKELELAGLIKGELEALGIKNISLSEKSILIAKIPSNLDAPAVSVAFFAHLDTSAEQSGDTKAQIVRYEGGDICLNKELEIYLKESENEELQDYKADEIIVTDGTSLLGADDKAAIAAIVNALEFFVQNPQIKHGEIIACFVPDEEQGLRGAKALDISEIGADFGYCLDCCGIGEFIYENWNAGDCVVTFKGQSAHPMNAKGKLVNSLLLAHKFISLLPAGEAPEYTEGKEGYFWVKELSGNSAKTVLKIDVREFDEKRYEQRMEFLQKTADGLRAIWGDRIEISLNDRYKNVYNFLKNDDAPAIRFAKQAFKSLNIEPKIKPMRGGYDGAVISAKGLPCPNLFTGGHNFHSIYEYLPVGSLKAASEVVKQIITLAAARA